MSAKTGAARTKVPIWSGQPLHQGGQPLAYSPCYSGKTPPPAAATKYHPPLQPLNTMGSPFTKQGNEINQCGPGPVHIGSARLQQHAGRALAVALRPGRLARDATC
jgi:hypothetical protein